MNLKDLGQETIDAVLLALAKGDLNKAGVTTGLGLQGYNLEAPSRKLYPVLSPLRNRIARQMAPIGSLAAHWKQITSINSLNVKAAVGFGARNSQITYVEAEKAATYKTFGLDDIVDDEAVWLGRGYEDVRALSALATLQSVMIEEEKLILGGVGTTANGLGTPATPTVSKTTSGGGAFAGATNFIQLKVVALSLYGYLNSGGGPGGTVFTGALGDHSLLSAKGSVQLAATTDSVQAFTTPVNGAFAYAWFVGEGAAANAADAAMFLMQITTVPYVTMTASPAGGNVAASTITTDTSYDANAFDGLFPSIINANGTLQTLATFSSGVLKVQGGGTDQTGAMVYDFNSTASAGSAFTADGAGGIKELDVVFKALWDRSRIGPTLLLMNSQEALSLTRVILGNNTGTTFRVPVNPGDKSITGGEFVTGYLNKFTSSMTPGMPDVVPFMIHPYLPPGTMIALSERLPYPNNNVPNVLEMEMQLEYTDFEFARTTRQYPHGVYAMGVFKNYFPAGCAVLRSIAAS